jgi:hypothetical protein
MERFKVPLAILGIRKEVEHGAIMPEVKGCAWFPARYVGDLPVYLAGAISQPGLGNIQSGPSDIQYGDIEAAIQQCID